MSVETREQVAELLHSLDEGLVTRAEILTHAGLALARSGSVNDVMSWPPWLQQELTDWAREFQQSDTWLLVSNSGEKDVSAAGRKLLALLRASGLLD
jgi:hypothetical protein